MSELDRSPAIELDHKPREECGVFAAYGPGYNLRLMAYEGLGLLQHRGQESAGITVSNSERLWSYGNLGLVRDVFNGGKYLMTLPADCDSVIGHVRYGTCIIPGYHDLPEKGQEEIMRAASQPMHGRSNDGQIEIALGFNGDIPNYSDFIEADPDNLGDSVSDADIIRRLVMQNINEGQSPVDALKDVANKLTGSAFSLAMQFKDHRLERQGIIAVRDPNGFRPFKLGHLYNPHGIADGWVIASESAAVRMTGAKDMRDINPGEMIVIDHNGLRAEQVFPDNVINPTPCALERIYLGRSDTEMDGKSNEEVRFRCGKLLAQNYPVDSDMVVGVPESGLIAASGYARASNLPLRAGIVKNRVATERSFIAPNGYSTSANGNSENHRQDLAFRKNMADPAVVKGKRIVLVDDSLIRGNTLIGLIKDLYEAGASEIHVRSASPQFISECHYGVDISSKSELIATGRSNKEIAAIIGADSLEYLDLPWLQTILGKAACYGCMTGVYPTELRKPVAESVLAV